LQNVFRKYLKELAHLSLIHRTHTIRDHFKYRDKQAHLERCNVVYTVNSNVHVVILLLLANLTGLGVLVLLLTSFASHCYFLRHRTFLFWTASIANCCFIFFDWRWIKNNPKRLKI